MFILNCALYFSSNSSSDTDAFFQHKEWFDIMDESFQNIREVDINMIEGKKCHLKAIWIPRFVHGIFAFSPSASEQVRPSPLSCIFWYSSRARYGSPELSCASPSREFLVCTALSTCHSTAELSDWRSQTVFVKPQSVLKFTISWAVPVGAWN